MTFIDDKLAEFDKRFRGDIHRVWLDYGAFRDFWRTTFKELAEKIEGRQKSIERNDVLAQLFKDGAVSAFDDILQLLSNVETNERN